MFDVRIQSRLRPAVQSLDPVRTLALCQWAAVIVTLALSSAAIARFALSGVSPSPTRVLIPASLFALIAFALQAVRLKQERTRAAAAMVQARTIEHRYTNLLDNSFDLSLMVDERGTITYANDATARMLGRPAWDLVGVCVSDLATADSRLRTGWLIEAARLGYPPRTVRIDLQSVSGEICALEAIARDRLEDPAIGGIAVSARDITRELDLTRERDSARQTDALTGLPNRTAFFSLADVAITRSTRFRRPIALMVIDLDHFHLVNDTCGVEIGDYVLRTVTERLRLVTPAGGTLARLNGDRFVALVEECSDAQMIDLAQRSIAAMREPVLCDGQTIPVSISIGCTGRSGADVISCSELINEAESALMSARRMGPGSWSVFHPSMTPIRNRLRIESELRAALESNQFSVFYQPVVALDEGTVVELEALIRWHHPERGLVSPGEFIPVAEQTGLIVPIGWWVLREACEQGTRWLTARPNQPLTMSVNLSPLMFRQPDLVNRVRSILAAANFPPQSLRLEITEGVMIENPGETSDRLRQLKALGVQLAIDDFGTGYSSLSYLRHFPVDVIKIDRAFVSTMAESTASAAIVQSIINLARALQMETTGEGIETEHQLQTLREMGSNRGQGYLFSKPLPAVDLEQLLLSTRTAEFAA